MRRFFEGLHLPQLDAVLRPVRVALPYKARKGRRIQDVLDGVVVVVDDDDFRFPLLLFAFGDWYLTFR